jgi:hypothetical protein
VRGLGGGQVRNGRGIGGLDQPGLGGEAPPVDGRQLRLASHRRVLDPRREAGEVQPAARDWRAHLPFARGEAVLRLALARLEQRNVAPEGSSVNCRGATWNGVTPVTG